MNRILILLLVIACLTSCKSTKNEPGIVYTFSSDSLFVQNQKNIQWKKSEAFKEKVLEFKSMKDANTLVITSGSDSLPWGKAKYLICELWHDNPYSAIVYVDFYKKQQEAAKTSIVQQGDVSTENMKQQPRISPKIGVLPNLKTRLIIPLSYLDGQQIFMQRFPRQLKGTVMGRRLDIADIGKVCLRFEPVMEPDYLTRMEISAIYLSDSIPAPFEKPAQPYVDEFGQWAMRDWPGKTHNEKELKDNLQELELTAMEARFPENWSKYGGWKDLKFKATGYFRVHNDGKRWWFVDPDGYAFLSAGVDCIGSNVTGTVTGQEDLFAWLPQDSIYKSALNERGDKKMINFLEVNLIRAFGNERRDKWENITKGLLKKWRVNTIANWSDIEFAQKSGSPYVLNMRNYPSTKTLLYRDFPDVFSDEYKNNAVEFAKQLDKFKNDPYLIGYFLSNEPHWAFGDNNIAFEMFATQTSSQTKNQFAQWLKAKYKTVDAFNQAWKQSVKNFEDIPALVMKESPSDECWADCKEFSGILVDTYVKTVCDEVKKVDPNHLNLGLRYAWISSELCYRAGAYFDVFSINGYSFPGPPETAEIFRRSGKPVLIGEYHFGATDRGLPATGIQGAENQEARGEAYRYYLEQGFARPELIGIHYFQWMDQPVFGRFDGENYNIGFLDICMKPYNELTEQATLSHERMYNVATGAEKPYDKVIRKTPQIFY